MESGRHDDVSDPLPLVGERHGADGEQHPRASRRGYGGVDGLGALSPVQVVQAGGDAGDPVAGYSIMQAADADELRTILVGHPHTAFGGTIEILEVLPLPGM